MGMRTSFKSVAVALLLSLCVEAQEQLPVIRGTWTGTSGAKTVYRGNWSATVKSSTPNAAQGSWILVNDKNQIVLQGTWSAEKTARGWQGTWAARIIPDKARGRATSAGRAITGTWQAAIEDPGTKTFVDMLRRTLTEEISGSWRSGAQQGGWWLKGTSQDVR